MGAHEALLRITLLAPAWLSTPHVSAIIGCIIFLMKIRALNFKSTTSLFRIEVLIDLQSYLSV
jgi:hypothetical protein